MYGVPADLPVQALVGQEVTFIGLGMHQVQIHFHDGSQISIEGAWRLHDRGGVLVDQQRAPADRDAYRIHRLLSKRVTAASIDAPNSFALTFEGGDSLTIADESQAHESFSLNVNGRSIFV